MRQRLQEKLLRAIYPATSVGNVSLDYQGNLFFNELYDYNDSIIGAGGFGIVLAAIDKHTHTKVAIKILNINEYIKTSTTEGSSFKVQRNLNFLRNEVTIAQEFSHPSIISVKKVYQSRHHVLIVMDRAKCSLSDYLKKKGWKLQEEECMIIMKQVLEGLKYLHITNIVHRDMKPGNILLMETKKLENSVRISDFGVSAKLTDALPCELSDTAGTFLYKAPEQFNGELCTTVLLLSIISILISGLLA